MIKGEPPEPCDGERRSRWRLDVGYDGTDFHGWAKQPGLRTVQGTLEEWLPRVLRLGAPVEITCAGRTDTGVHARGQVCHVDLAAGMITDGGATLLRRLARVLPADLVVEAVTLAPDFFDARFAAGWRRYSYRVHDDPAPPDPLLRRFVTHWPARLDLEAMNAVAADLIGLRDFAPFCKRRVGASSVRTLLELTGSRTGQQPRSMIDFRVRADAFCHSMVRSLIGAVVAVGSGRRDRNWLKAVAAGSVRDSSVLVMPPHGLCLEEVGYPAPDELRARVEQTRRVRTPAEATEATETTRAVDAH